VTYETFPSMARMEASPLLTTRTVVEVSKGHASGRLHILENPRTTFSIREPMGGCGNFVNTSVSAAHYGSLCQFANNAGFFNTVTGECLGPLVSDGRLLQNPGTQNSVFGLRSDGSFTMGYVSQADVEDQVNPFRQLIAGVVWLVRNGRVYVDEALGIEGVDQAFADIDSARVAIGHDSSGRLLLLQFDGRSREWGIDLYTMANRLVSLGFVNAVNLDGGGSVAAVRNSAVISYPSDPCKDDPRFNCERAVTSVLCFGDRTVF